MTLELIKDPVPWPNGARCAVAITFDIDTDSILHLEYPDRAKDLIASNSWLKYDEIAIPRILDIYRHFGLKQTFYYPAWCMEHYPHLVDMILKDGHEIAAHGYLHENANHMSRERQRYWMDKQVAVIEKMTGEKPRGWRGPLYNASGDSPELCRAGHDLRRHPDGRRHPAHHAHQGGRHDRPALALGDGRLAPLHPQHGFQLHDADQEPG